jgi:hypothetical protein
MLGYVACRPDTIPKRTSSPWVGVDRRIDRNERLIGPWGRVLRYPAMRAPSRSGLPGDENTQSRHRDTLHLVEDLLHSRALTTMFGQVLGHVAPQTQVSVITRAIS